MKDLGWMGAAMLCAALLSGCTRGSEGDGAAAPPPKSGSALPASLRLGAAPDAARGVKDVKASAKEGDEVVIRGRIGGSRAPFVDGRAMMTLVDLDGVTSCAAMEMGGDGCETPWDYCCEPAEVLVPHTATVQVVGPDARPLAVDIRKLEGLEPLKVVVVKGVVGPRPDPAVLIVNATGIYVE